MKFELRRACKMCPFRRGGQMRLTPERVDEISALFDNRNGGQGGTFTCHETLNYDTESGDPENTEKTQHCAGALIYCEKHESPTQMMRIAERLRMYDHKALRDRDRVWNNLEEWLKGGTTW